MISIDIYSMKEMYGKMTGAIDQVYWRNLVWSNYEAIKWWFTMYITLNRRLATKTRLDKWGLIDSTTCLLC